jgi:hypothetical protein
MGIGDRRRWSDPRRHAAAADVLCYAARGGAVWFGLRGSRPGSARSSRVCSSWPSRVRLRGGRRCRACGTGDRRDGQSACGGPVHAAPPDGRRQLAPNRRPGSRRAARAASEQDPGGPVLRTRRSGPGPDSDRLDPGRAGARRLNRIGYRVGERRERDLGQRAWLRDRRGRLRRDRVQPGAGRGPGRDRPCGGLEPAFEAPSIVS